MPEEAPRYFSRGEITRYLEENEIALKKRWGQNFLCDPNVLRKLVALLRPESRHVWEIGPGLGVLTHGLLEAGFRVTAFEIDWGLVRALGRLFAGEELLRVIPGDVLNTWRAEWQLEQPQAIIGNLPYRSSQAILARLLEAGAVPEQLVATLQSEVAGRALASPGSSAYSSFSVLLQTRCTVLRHFDISGACFFPRPDVSSTVIELRPKDDVQQGKDLAGYAAFVQGCFRARRKTLLNNLKKDERRAGRSDLELETLLRRHGIRPNMRPEEIAPAQFYAIYAEMESGPPQERRPRSL